jgi:hypothetical protein
VLCQIFGAFECDGASGIYVIDPLLDQMAQFLYLAFFAAKQSQPGRNNVFGVSVSSVCYLLLDEGEVLLAEMDLGHFDLLLFSFSMKISGFQEA